MYILCNEISVWFNSFLLQNLQSSTICCYDLFGLQERSKSPVTDPQIVTLIFTGLQLFSGIPIEFHFLQLTESPPYPF
uniref:Uncharacterized protein n=1 Tax=Trichobilharzia regenti TaxID=157069 RepID=A0AA85JLK0_TRIRE|nr:unnamed protein product [Trichobilharzia regenti]CAH8876331.1 unnamed protein product [Trichobilharzia regenti]